MSEMLPNADSRLAAGGVAAAVAPVGAAIGALGANALSPAHVKVLDGIELEASLSIEDGLDGNFPISNLDAPNVPIDSPIPTLDGLTAHVTNLSPHLDSTVTQEAFNNSLISEFPDLVAHPVHDAIIENLTRGGVIGFLGAAAVGYSYMRLRSLEEPLIEVHPRLGKISKKLAVGGALVLSALSITSSGAESEESTEQVTPLGPAVTRSVPELKGATLSGTPGSVIARAINDISKAKPEIDNTWKKGAKSFEEVYEDYEKGAGKNLVRNPDVVTVLQASDFKCNYATYKNYYKPIIRRISPDIVVNTGDTFTNSNTQIYEKNCFNGFTNAVRNAASSNSKKITIINTAGNHDPKEPINFNEKNVKAVTLHEGKMTTRAMGINFVGIEDPAKSVWGPTLPTSKAELNQRLRVQGEKVADAACKLEERPVITTSKPELATESIARGCAKLVLNGSHKNAPVKKYIITEGQQVLQHTAGTASGAGRGPVIYGKPQEKAAFTVQYYNKKTMNFTDFTTFSMDLDSNVSLTHEVVNSGNQRTMVPKKLHVFKRPD